MEVPLVTTLVEVEEDTMAEGHLILELEEVDQVTVHLLS
jgi:hypothetical protein